MQFGKGDKYYFVALLTLTYCFFLMGLYSPIRSADVYLPLLGLSLLEVSIVTSVPWGIAKLIIHVRRKNRTSELNYFIRVPLVLVIVFYMFELLISLFFVPYYFDFYGILPLAVIILLMTWHPSRMRGVSALALIGLCFFGAAAFAFANLPPPCVAPTPCDSTSFFARGIASTQAELTILVGFLPTAWATFAFWSIKRKPLTQMERQTPPLP